MKKRIVYIAALVVMLSLFTGGTLAYFTAEDTVRNEITAGAVKAEVAEYTLTEGGLLPYPQQAIQVMPGQRVSKIVTARSLEQPAWIRMAYEITVYDAQGQVMDISDRELETVIGFEGRDAGWTCADGWWYYAEAVGKGDSTQPLFDTVTFSAADMGNEYQECTVQIQVTVQAVQKANNGETVFDAAGWPAE